MVYDKKREKKKKRKRKKKKKMSVLLQANDGVFFHTSQAGDFKGSHDFSHNMQVVGVPPNKAKKNYIRLAQCTAFFFFSKGIITGCYLR